MLNINPETVQFIIDRAHQFQMWQQQDGDTDPMEGSDPAFAEIKSTIDDLEPDQQVELVGLMWLGRGDYSVDEWAGVLSDAGDSWNERTAGRSLELWQVSRFSQRARRTIHLPRSRATRGLCHARSQPPTKRRSSLCRSAPGMDHRYVGGLQCVWRHAQGTRWRMGRSAR